MNKFLILLAFLLIAITASACTQHKAGILFNKNPITPDTVMNNSVSFPRNTRIYYLILIPKSAQTRYAYIQIIKKDNDEGRLGYKLYWGNTVKLKDEQMYYYDDYIVLNEPGVYVMQVYLKDKPHKVHTRAQFFVTY